MPWTKIPSIELTKPDKESLRELTYSDALNEAHLQLLEGDPRVFVMGEGVDDPGGIFGTTTGLQERFGRERVFDTPLAENAMTGVAIGAAIAGMRPILVHMRVDFMLLTMDQLVNHASKWHYMFGAAVSVPLTVRAIVGRGWGSAAQHSQNLHAMFAHVPGLKVVMPSTPFDAKGLMVAAAADPNPVIIIEHRWLFNTAGHVPEEPYKVEIGKAAVTRVGKDVTIVGISQMAHMALHAAEELEAQGIDAEVIDIRSLRPLDSKTVIGSVKKTNRLVVADTGWKGYGMGAEIIARIAEESIADLKTPPVRVNTAEVPTPASHVLEEAFYPDTNDIVEAVRKTLS